MARRSGAKKKSIQNDNKAQIAKLLDTRRQDKGKNNNKITKPTKNIAKLEDAFTNVMKKFEITDNGPLHKDINHESKGADNEIGSELASLVEAESSKNKDKEEEKKNESTGPSKRKQRIMNKPSLSQLKSSVIHPEVIEWYDCDAPYPYVLASIKASKNVIPVPSHWQTKREYLSGRSLLSKKPFELPDIIKMTDIEQMRSTLPTQEENEKSLKELARARVQVKTGTLDIDYRRTYNIFFKIGAQWKQDLLLPFGDMYYENRTLHDEAQWRKMIKDKIPGKLSETLRTAMGLEDGQLPPWCMAMNEIGMPPAYPDMQVAGINWDISNLKDGIYAKVTPLQKSRQKSKNQKNYFGSIISFEKDDPLETIYEKKVKEPVAEDTKETENLTAKTDNKTNDDRIPLTEFETKQTTPKVNEQNEEDNQEKSLYTVIETDTSGEKSSLTGSVTSYKLNRVNKTSDSTKLQETIDDTEQSEEELEKFKF
ncbi:similar to Saccharomyces cerevisiae YMR240C CUS1 Protein required for assembly of U2 snRNP into the spliceosome, forms a complex with Hsh49p and Hsh155p [Maudiozyma saulgeensis]|uniref:Similar to Saccharomyces cerevisiae YMR240C CUS1 Protein required for assembly of U2 snRNP into the spliceosome, forms a complex with Hsh49p and Hsh155p n=1 Tax=Maudiozyma saulgeensis TaxID=1789683 RepID=A0A1X7R9D6_9SACH|nr:similar to Saccharomyces cerevisiae YMR240C CUS1 Protein required for assembly of U2 snRNP into the spliceosome, forms a complex with Hsh49p and Hsh155p [Kazachstania saulgeensis]